MKGNKRGNLNGAGKIRNITGEYQVNRKKGKIIKKKGRGIDSDFKATEK